MRLIDADTLKERFEMLSYDDWNQDTGTTWARAFEESAEVVEAAPTIDPVKHGRWEFEPEAMYCSVCGWVYEYYAGLEEEWNYCPNCGAKMEGEEE